MSTNTNETNNAHVKDNTTPDENGENTAQSPVQKVMDYDAQIDWVEGDTVKHTITCKRGTVAAINAITKAAKENDGLKDGNIVVRWFEAETRKPVEVFSGPVKDYVTTLMQITFDTNTALKFVEDVITKVFPRSHLKCIAVTAVAENGSVSGLSMVNESADYETSDIIGFASAIADHADHFKKQYKEKYPDADFGDGPEITLVSAADAAKVLSGRKGGRP